MDTPRIGALLQVRMFGLPTNAALVVLGFASSTLALAPYGMPGCTAYVTVDAVQFVAGANRQAVLPLPVPSLPSLAGATFHLQALVPDPAAGNGLGAVMSDAATAIVGR